MDVEERQREWWRSLSDFERTQALTVFEQLPAWLEASLERARLAVVEVDITSSKRVCLMPTRLREFLDQKTNAREPRR